MGRHRSGNCERQPISESIRDIDMRLSRPRMLIAEHLSAKGEWHFSAEQLHAELAADGKEVSLATVYNTLHRFCEAGLVRPLPIRRSRTFFDTNTLDHQHFYIEDDECFIDISTEASEIRGLPDPPCGMQIVAIDLVIRLKRRQE